MTADAFGNPPPLTSDATGVPDQESESIEILSVDDAEAVAEAVAAEAEDDEQEIQRAVDKLVPIEQGARAATEATLPKGDNYIPDSAFEAVGGSPTVTDEKARARTLEEIRVKHGIKFRHTETMSDSIVTSLRCLLIDGILIADDDALKRAMLLVLPVMDPRRYQLDETLKEQKPRVLFRMFRRELRGRSKTGATLADKLEAASGGHATPPPLPPSSTKK